MPWPRNVASRRTRRLRNQGPEGECTPGAIVAIARCVVIKSKGRRDVEEGVLAMRWQILRQGANDEYEMTVLPLPASAARGWLQ